MKERIKTATSLYLRDRLFRANLSLYCGFAINVAYVVFNMIAGIYHHSTWFGAIAIYYLVLGLLRFFLLHHARRIDRSLPPEAIRRQELCCYRFVGGFLFLLNIAMTVMVVQVVLQNRSYEYPGYIIYLSAAFAFYCFSSSIPNVIHFHKKRQAVVSAAKMISFAASCMSIYSTQTALLAKFGSGGTFQRIINSVSGGAVCLAVLVMATYMLIHASHEIEKHKNGRLYYMYLRCEGDSPTLGKTSQVVLAPSDVLHIPGLGFDGLVGYSPIAMAKNAIGLAIATEEYGAKFFANGAAPGGVLEHPGTIKDPQKVKESWNAAYQGSTNAHRVAVLEEGMKYQAIAISPEQAQFLETRKFQINEIARIFRVPPHMLADLEKSSFSNIEQQSLEFVKYTLDPWVIRWEQAMNKALLLESEKPTVFIKFNVDGLLRGDYQSRMNGYATARQNGWMSANDIRELENLDRIPAELGGDLYLINGAMTKLQDAGAFANTKRAEDTSE